MKIILFILFILFPSITFAQNCVQVPIVTGYGYMTDSNGNVLHYNISDPSLDKNICVPQGLTYTEVQNQQALNSIQIYIPPLTSEQQQEVLIQQNMRALAIADLESKGVLTSDQANAQTANLTTLNTAISTSQNQTVNATLP